jgi:hypothetical protein
MPTYNAYHTNLILLYKCNALPDEFKKVIPSSTLTGWKTRELAKILGCDAVADQDMEFLRQVVLRKKLIKTAKAFYLVFSAVAKLFQLAANKAELLKQHTALILQTIQRVKPTLGVKRVLRWLHLSPAKMYYWMEDKNCSLSLSALCRSKHPAQLLDSEVKTIKHYLLDDRFKSWSSLSVYYQALREKAVFVGINTWYKYARRLGIKRKFFRLKHKMQIGIRASRPLEILHSDVTLFKPLDNTRMYVYLLIDNFSRYILAWKASLEYSSEIALNVLRDALRKYNITFNTQLITDGGPENKGEVSHFLSGNDFLTRRVAQKDIMQSNSMVEAVNKHLKYYYLFKKDLKDFNETFLYLEKSIEDYNHKPHGKLLGLTPFEVLSGRIPARSLFREQIRVATKLRLQENMKFSCCNQI